jgi:hypothetical protein
LSGDWRESGAGLLLQWGCNSFHFYWVPNTTTTLLHPCVWVFFDWLRLRQCDRLVAATGLAGLLLEGHGYTSLVPSGETVAIVLCTLVYLYM